VLRVTADSIEESVAALRQLVAEVWYSRRTESTAFAAAKKGVDTLNVCGCDKPAPRRQPGYYDNTENFL